MKTVDVLEKMAKLVEANGLSNIEVIDAEAQGDRFIFNVHVNDFVAVVENNSSTCSGYVEKGRLVLKTRWYFYPIGEVVFTTTLCF